MWLSLSWIFFFSDLPLQGKSEVVHATQEQVSKLTAVLLSSVSTQHFSYQLSTQEEKVKVNHAQSCPTLETPWTTAAYQAPLSMGFSRQGNWSGLPFPSPGDLPNPGIEPGSPALQADALPSESPGKPPGSVSTQYFSHQFSTQEKRVLFLNSTFNNDGHSQTDFQRILTTRTEFL